MKRQEWILEKIASVTDLEAEAPPKLPLVELAGQRRVLIENHQGVIQYGAQEICINVSFGHINVQGNHLKLAKMTKEQLIITGLISGVSLCSRRV